MLNCACSTQFPTSNLGDLRQRLLRRAGYAGMIVGPGLKDLADDFIRDAQDVLFERYDLFRLTRFFTWTLVPGQALYTLDQNDEAVGPTPECSKLLVPDRIHWAGTEIGGTWRPLIAGIPNTLRGGVTTASIPTHYAVRQCIELWPTPQSAGLLRIEGQFGVAPLILDTDTVTLDPQAVLLLAIANMKAHLGQADAGNYVAQFAGYVDSLAARQHGTRRYITGRPGLHHEPEPISIGLP